MIHTSNRPYQLLITPIVVVLSTFIAFGLFADYFVEQDFLTNRLANNFSAGNSFVYNSGDFTLLTMSPLRVIAMALNSDLVVMSSILHIIGMTSLTIALSIWLASKNIPASQIITIIFIVALAYPTWSGMRSAESLMVSLVLVTMLCIDKGKYRTGGMLLGLAPLFAPSGIIALGIGLIYAMMQRNDEQRFDPSFIFGMFAPISIWLIGWSIFHGIDALAGLGYLLEFASATTADWLWLALFVGSVIVISQHRATNALYIFVLWGTLDILTPTILGGTPAQISSIPACITIALACNYVLQTLSIANMMRSGIAIIIMGVLLVLAPPTTPQHITDERALAETLNIETDATVLHSYSPAFAYFIPDFNGTVYHFDGRYNPTIEDMALRNDKQSIIVALAPDVIITQATDTTQFESQNLLALNYQQSTNSENLWERQAVTIPLDTEETLNIAFSPDVRLTSYAIDRTRPQSNEVMRLRLDWALNRTPEDSIGVNLSVLNINLTPVVSIFTSFPEENWQDDQLSTYHSIRLPEEVDGGLHYVQVGLDYRAGLLGVHRIAPIIVPFEAQIALDDTTRIGTLTPVNLFIADTNTQDSRLWLDLVWQPTAPLQEDYRVFIHVTSMDDLQPITQDDGLPLNGHYPTSFWLPDEIILETRQVDISMLEAGTYRINIGLYTPETGRLQGEEGDYLFVGTLTVNGDGSAEVTLNGD